MLSRQTQAAARKPGPSDRVAVTLAAIFNQVSLPDCQASSILIGRLKVVGHRIGHRESHHRRYGVGGIRRVGWRSRRRRVSGCRFYCSLLVFGELGGFHVCQAGSFYRESCLGSFYITIKFSAILSSSQLFSVLLHYQR